MNKKNLFLKASLIAATVIFASNCFANTAPSHLLAGYLDITAAGSAQKVSMQAAKQDGYNTIIFAFANIDGTNVTLNTAYQNIAKTKLAAAKSQQMIPLISFGGQKNTFKPGNLNNNQINTLASNIVNFVKSYGFAGVDFDIEVKTSPEFLDNLIKNIKSIDSPLIITAAPQINNGKLVTTGDNTDYSQAISNGDFNYLFLQEYNTGPETSPDFISSSFNQIKANIPATTKLIVGEPTAAVAGGSATIYHPNNSTTLTTQQVTPLMLPELKQIYFDPHFGGVMGWSLNVDYDAVDYGDPNHIEGTYAYGLKPCVVDGQCDTPPTPKKPSANYTLQTSNLGSKLGIVVDINSNTAKFTSDYIAPTKYTLYSKTSIPSANAIENKTNLTVSWSTYPGGPTGTCSNKLSFTANANIMINAGTKACEIKTMP